MKRVSWPEPKIHEPKRKAGTYGSFREMMAKTEGIRKEQEQAQEFLQKAHPYMLKLLEYRLANNHPLTVMRPFRYQTSEIQKAEEDDGFYSNRRSSSIPKFVDVIKVITPGTQLVLKSIDNMMQEFIFEDALNKEYCLSFSERDNMMTQTDIWETTRDFLDKQSK